MIKTLIKIIFLFVIVLINCNTYIYAQSKKELENQKKRTLEEIEYTNKLIESTKKEEKKNTNNLFIIEKNIKNRKKLIKQINKELEISQTQIENYELVIGLMTEDLKKLSKSYANLINMAWKNYNKQNALMFVLASKDFNQSYLRIRYIQQLSTVRKQQLFAIKEIKTLLEDSKIKVETEKSKKEELLDELNGVKKELETEQEKQQTTINELKIKGKELEKQLQQQQLQYKQLQEKIDKLIAEEIRKAQEQNKENTKNGLSSKEQTLSTEFGNNMGILPFPLEKGVIIKQFGIHPHPANPTIKIDSKGIEIQTNEAAEVKTVFDGEVRQVIQMQGMHTVIIIKHGEYFTIYANLVSATVKSGDMVTTKQKIGTVFTNTTENKTILYFEIRKGTQVLNPATWIKQ